jgi:hydroxypyruvate reductase/glycerate 2-kinase
VQGGETTVALPPVHGKGGRNQEFALSVLAELGAEGLDGACVLSGGTDGEDGPTDAAGAVADADVARQAAARGLDPRDFLDRHDAYRFFDPLGALVRTGFTDTNVMDLRIVLLDRTEGASVAAAAEPVGRLAETKPAPR